MTTAGSSSSSDQRYHALDGLRAVMMLLGLVLHAAISYGPFPYRAWPYKDISTHAACDTIVLGIHSFRMPIFFVMAGFFAALLYARRGPLGLLGNRCARILVPFVVAWIILLPLNATGFAFALTAKESSLSAGWQVTEQLLAAPLRLYHAGTDHLWFLYYLLYFYAAGLVLVPLLGLLPSTWRSRIASGFARMLGSPMRAGCMAVPTALTLFMSPGGSLETSTAFIPSAKVLLAYSIFFGFGWALYGHRELLSTFKRRAWLQVLLAGILVPVNLGAVERTASALPEVDTMGRLVASITGALVVWLLVFGITGLFLRYLDRPMRSVRYIVDASYWMYLIHLPFTIWIPGLLSGLAWPALLKVMLVLAIAAPIWLASYEFLVRNTLIGRVLNGRRYPRGLPAMAEIPLFSARPGEYSERSQG